MAFMNKNTVKIVDFDDAQKPYAVYEPGQKPVMCVSYKAACNVARLCPQRTEDLTNPRLRA